MKTTSRGYFQMTSPESLGINRQAIHSFIEKSELKGLELHRFMILRHGKCCAKVIWSPYSENDLHPLYSFSKSITATAIAFAIKEGLLSLDEKLVDLFPEDCPEEISENLAKCKVHHLLCMSCGHETEPECNTEDWKKVFLSHPFLHEPGSFFKYNTAGSNMLSAIVRKKTGMQVTEYLRPRLFDPLGIGDVVCFELPDKDHTQHGGGGMKMRLEDMAKFSQFMLQDGVWEGKSLLPDWYHSNAGIKQIETEGDSEGHVYEWAKGYGYQCWMCSPERSFRADGAFGQFGLIYPTLDMCIIMNAATEQTQTIIDLVNEYLIPAAGNEASKEDGDAYIEERSLMPLSSCRNPLFENILNHTVYRPEKVENPLCGLQNLVGGAGHMSFEEREINEIRFKFFEDRVRLYLLENGIEKALDAGLERSFLYTEIDGYTYASSAKWRALRKLEIEIRRMDALSGVRLLLKFEDERLIMEADDTLMTDGGLGIVERNMVPFVQMADLRNLKTEKTGNNPAVK